MTTRARAAAAVLTAVGVAVIGGPTLGCSSDEATTTTTTTTDTSAPQNSTAVADDGEIVIDGPGPVQLAVGERATLALDANPTTGYEWASADEQDGSVVRIVEDSYVPGSTDAVGAGGSQRIVIEGVAAGTTTLELRYVRPWEPDEEPAETASFDITVS